jgi:insertion element IS1 protein InsB
MCNSIKTYCPRCLCANVKKNGLFNKQKTQQYKCKSCSKKFFLTGSSYFISDFKKDLVKDLLLERLSLRGICRVLKVSLTWLLAFLKEIWSDLPDDLNVKLNFVKKMVSGRFYIEMRKCEADELWSFVQNKACVQYIWLVQDRETRQVVAYEIGDRSRSTATKLWDKIPKDLKENALFYTDDWDSYKTVIPEGQHLCSKYKKDTNHIERLNCTIRHRCSRLVRKNLAFSKSLENHHLAIKYFICNYNLWCQKNYEQTAP